MTRKANISEYLHLSVNLLNPTNSWEMASYCPILKSWTLKYK
jgi:hypothetical protein